MTDWQIRKLKVLRALCTLEEPTRPTDIGELAGEAPRETGRILSELAKSGLAEKPDKKQSLWQVTERGRECAENPPESWQETTAVTVSDKGQSERTAVTVSGKGQSERTGVIPKEKEVDEKRKEVEIPPGQDEEVSVPSQADILKRIGEKLSIGRKKGEVNLDSIVYYVEAIANLDNLTSVWNAFTDMGIASSIKKRWINLYAQSLRGKKIPDELKEKMETIEESDKVAEEGKPGEVLPKPKRFTLIGNDIMGDPEGDLTFKEALQQRAQNLGAKPEQANEAATIIEAMKVGPEMSTSMLTAFMPLLTKEPPKQDNAAITILQQRIEQLADDKHKAEIEVLRTEMRSGQKSEPDPQIQALTQQISDMREALHNEQIARMQEQNKSMIDQMIGKLGQLEEQVKAAREGRVVDSKISLMSETIHQSFGELRGLREDIKPLVQDLALTSRERSPAKRRNKVGFSEGLDQGIEKEKKLRGMEDRLFLGKE